MILAEQTCPACGKSGDLTQIHPGLYFKGALKLPVWMCKVCQHRWMPTNNEEQQRIEKIYSSTYSGFRIDPFFNNVVEREFDQRIERLAPSTGKLLDVGCGNGEFLMLATRRGYDAMGVDISADGVGIARNKGLNAHHLNFLNHSFDEKFSLITMWDVMEHLRQPDLFLRKSLELLSEQGFLLLKIPSFGALNFPFLRLFPRSSSVLLGAPDHIQYYSNQSIAALLSRVGFRHVIWFESRKFRTKPPTNSLKRKLSRGIQTTFARLASNHNIYLCASLHEPARELLDQVPHSHNQTLANN